MASSSALGVSACTVRTSVLSPQRIARCENALPPENFARISIIALISDRDGTIHFGGLNVSDQPTKLLSGRTRAEKTSAAAQIRLDDLIPQKRPEGRPPNGVWCQFAKTLNKTNYKHESKIIQAVQERQTRCQDQRPQANQRCQRGGGLPTTRLERSIGSVEPRARRSNVRPSDKARGSCGRHLSAADMVTPRIHLTDLWRASEMKHLHPPRNALDHGVLGEASTQRGSADAAVVMGQP
jgi:hypothetical protein